MIFDCLQIAPLKKKNCKNTCSQLSLQTSWQSLHEDGGEKSHDFFSPDQNPGLTRRSPEEGTIWARRPIKNQGRAGRVPRFPGLRSGSGRTRTNFVQWPAAGSLQNEQVNQMNLFNKLINCYDLKIKRSVQMYFGPTNFFALWFQNEEGPLSPISEEDLHK